MRITKKNLSDDSCGFANIEQIGAKQLFTAAYNNKRILISYKTIIGIFDDTTKEWLVTNKKYSQTTSRQISFFSRTNTIKWIPETELQIYLNSDWS